MQPLQVLAAPRRMRILELVWVRELAAGDIAAEFNVSWSAISQHLTVLKDAGFIVERREGTKRIYRADKVALGSLRAVVEDHWRNGLNTIKHPPSAWAAGSLDQTRTPDPGRPGGNDVPSRLRS
jgi:DNA-binding transcriptional ArsR family regulator